MNLLRKLKKLLKYKPKFAAPPTCNLKFAFEVEGVKSYCPENAGELPSLRALMAHLFYREVEMKCTLTFLKDWNAAHKKLTSGAKFGMNQLVQVKQLEKALDERLELPWEPETVIKLASVFFIDEGEDPNVYDIGYNKGKIERMKRHPEHLAFFLSHPLINLMPYISHSEVDIQAYSRLMEDVNKIHQALVSEILSENVSTILNEKKSGSPVGSLRKSTPVN